MHLVWQIPPEVRRIVSFMQRFLPELFKTRSRCTRRLCPMSRKIRFRYGRRVVALAYRENHTVGANTVLENKTLHHPVHARSSGCASCGDNAPRPTPAEMNG